MRLAVALLVAVLTGSAARAESCGRSLDYIMNDLAGSLPQPASTYRHLLSVCLQTLTMANVKDAYLMKDGGIAVVPKDNSVVATAGTLSEFCQRYPRNTLRFINRREQRRGLTTGLVVLMSSSTSESCLTIRGGQ